MSLIEKRRLFVVLGMHRSGTSAITKSLELLGIGLGSDLHPAGFDNPKGFWEDRECIEINDVLLGHLGSAYDQLGLAWSEIYLDSQVSALRLRATQHIRRKLEENNNVWGFKDPRTCRLLCFWGEVFQALKCEVNFILAIRNPASVATSLAIRNGIPAEKSYFLWLQHVLPSLTVMPDVPRIVVDYDEFIDHPYTQLSRIATCLGLELPDGQSPTVKDFANNFLESALRHSRFSEEELELDNRASALAVQVYGLLQQLATDQTSIDSTDVQKALEKFNLRLKDAEPIFKYTSSLENEKTCLLRLVDNRNNQVDSLQHIVAERDANISNLNQVMIDRTNELQTYRMQADEFVRQIKVVQEELIAARESISSLNQMIAERNAQIADLNIAMIDQANELQTYRVQADEFVRQIKVVQEELIAARENISSLNQMVAERNAQIASINQMLIDQAKEIEAYRIEANEHQQKATMFHSELSVAQTHNDRLNQTISEREGQINDLKDTLSAYCAQNTQLRHHLKELLFSRSWKVTKPLRFISTIVRRIPPSSMVVGLNDLSDRPAQVGLNHPSVSLDIYGNASESFDRDFYLKMYPDVKASGTDPEEHYYRHGNMEGRLGCAPALDLMGGFDEFDLDSETILVVSHEASLTGAPVLSLNIVQAFAPRYNVVAMVLGGGTIEKAFHDAGAVVVRAHTLRNNPLIPDLLIESLLKETEIKFAIINSIESRYVLPALAKRYVPTISLIHEFAAYTRPREAFREAVFWSGEVVFSANITLESALHEFPDLDASIGLVLPQGRCLVPTNDLNRECLEIDRSRIFHTFRPSGADENTIVVLGAGFVQLRKGVDLFIECASRVAQANSQKHYRFIWIGRGFDPEIDVNYSVYLADQIKRAGLEESVFFLDETPAIDLAYEQADMLLLSSRLDPLPNVAIDAMVHGLPVLCFDKTTGIAEILSMGGLADACVAKYLDTEDMANKIMAMADSEMLRQDIGQRSRALALTHFDMHSYVAKLEKLADEVCIRIKQEKEDFEVIADSESLHVDFVCPPNHAGQPDNQVILGYVRGWRTGVGRRKPFPGFHPGVYLEKKGLAESNSDPFAAFLRAGRPSGAWLQQVITPRRNALKTVPNNVRVAIHIHVFYPALLGEMVERMMLNRVRPNLFISVPNERVRQTVEKELHNYSGQVAGIQIVPNRGRDIGPFLTAFGKEIVANYDMVGHLHTKVSADVKDSSVGKIWYQFLLENLLGGQKGAMADTIIASMIADPSIGLVFPDDPNVVGWGGNRDYAETLAKKLSIKKLTENFNFPVGTMFWARVSALRPLIDLGLGWDDYPEEPLSYDGTLLHAIERILPFLVTESNLRNVVTHIPGTTR